MRIEEIINSLQLRTRDRALIVFHFGLVDRHFKTYRETGLRFAISAERVRQIVSKISRRMRHPSKRTLAMQILNEATDDHEWEALIRLLGQPPETRFGSPYVKLNEPTVLSKVSSSDPVRYMRNEFGLAALRTVFPRAYEAWSDLEDTQLKDGFMLGRSCSQLVRDHGRSPSAIVERLVKLNLVIEGTFAREMKSLQREARESLRRNPNG
jgi:hypothetical protein